MPHPSGRYREQLFRTYPKSVQNYSKATVLSYACLLPFCLGRKTNETHTHSDFYQCESASHMNLHPTVTPQVSDIHLLNATQIFLELHALETALSIYPAQPVTPQVSFIVLEKAILLASPNAVYYVSSYIYQVHTHTIS